MKTLKAKSASRRRIRFAVILSLLAAPASVSAAVIHTPEYREETAHAEALHQAELAAGARKLPAVKISAQPAFAAAASSGFQSAVQMEMPLFRKGLPGLEAGRAALDRARYEYLRRSRGSEYLFEFEKAYASGTAAEEDLELIREIREILQNLYARESLLASERLLPVTGSHEIRRRLHELESEKLRSEQMLYEARAVTGYLLGLEPESFRWEQIRITSGDPETGEGTEASIAEALLEHPEILTLENESAVQELRIKEASRQWMPEVHAVASFQQDPRFRADETQFFAGARVNMTLWDFGAGGHETQMEKSFGEELASKRERLLKQKTREALQANRNYRMLLDLHAIQTEQIRQEDSVMKSLQLRMEAGEIPLNDYERARARLLELTRERLKLRTEMLLARAEMRLRLGQTDFNVEVTEDATHG